MFSFLYNSNTKKEPTDNSIDPPKQEVITVDLLKKLQHEIKITKKNIEKGKGIKSIKKINDALSELEMKTTLIIKQSKKLNTIDKTNETFIHDIYNVLHRLNKLFNDIYLDYKIKEKENRERIRALSIHDKFDIHENSGDIDKDILGN